MMCSKALLFEDYNILGKMFSTSDPKLLKALGQKVQNFDQKKWDAFKLDIVILGNYLKFSQNLNLKQKLIQTEKAILAEASPYDKVWGIGLSADNDLANSPDSWRGENLLGYALMTVRNIF